MFGLELRDLVENLLLRRDPLPKPFAGAGQQLGQLRADRRPGAVRPGGDQLADLGDS